VCIFVDLNCLIFVGERSLFGNNLWTWSLFLLDVVDFLKSVLDQPLFELFAGSGPLDSVVDFALSKDCLDFAKFEDVLGISGLDFVYFFVKFVTLLTFLAFETFTFVFGVTESVLAISFAQRLGAQVSEPVFIALALLFVGFDILNARAMFTREVAGVFDTSSALSGNLTRIMDTLTVVAVSALDLFTVFARVVFVALAHTGLRVAIAILVAVGHLAVFEFALISELVGKTTALSCCKVTLAVVAGLGATDVIALTTEEAFFALAHIECEALAPL